MKKPPETEWQGEDFQPVNFCLLQRGASVSSHSLRTIGKHFSGLVFTLEGVFLYSFDGGRPCLKTDRT